MTLERHMSIREPLILNAKKENNDDGKESKKIE